MPMVQNIRQVSTLSADLNVAWAHQFNNLPITQASFVILPSSSFQQIGARIARDSALLGFGVEHDTGTGLSIGIKAQGQIGSGTTAVQGMGNVTWRW